MSLPAPDIRATAAAELLGQTLSGRFRLDSLLGHGAMGAVFKAHHLGLHKDVALKLLHPELTANDEMVARFDREAAAASRLDHPNCVRTMDFGSTEDGRRYLVMEFLEGKDLADIVLEPMPPFRVVDLILQVLEGLAHAHAQGLVHRDIKNENIFVLGGESGEQVKLLDFGIAKVSHGAGAGQLTQAGIIFGTPHYMSPEQARGEKADARSDLYSLGIVMHSMLAGDLPFHGDDALAILRGQISEEPPKLPDSVPGSLRHFVRQLLAKQPEERFTDAAAAIAALKRAASPTERSAKSKLPPPPEFDLRGQSMERTETHSLADTEADEAADEPIELPQQAEVALLKAEGPDSDSGSALELVELEPEEEPGEESESSASAPPPASAGTRDTDAEDTSTTIHSVPGSERPPWLLPAVGVGVLGLFVLIVAAWPDGDEVESESEVAAAGAFENGDEKVAAVSEEPDPVLVDDDTPDPEPDTGDGDTQVQSKRALRATLASVDALIESKKYDAARITIGPLLEVYGDEPELHWRMGAVLVALGRKVNAAAALESYRAALSLKSELLDDEEFSTTFWDLLDDPRNRELASQIAVELLGEQGHERLARWVNVQKSPLPYALRQTVTEHLRAADQGARINEPLQTALDLWQSSAAQAPCEAFTAALEAATENPDSYLLGTLAAVSVPKTGESDELVECPGLAEALTSARGDYARRYAGLDPAVPAAYGRRKSAGRKRRR
ncbi:MAG: serine/threonine-protein kinase [Nannocystales bacterium]